MILELNSGICPIVDVGMYGGMLDPNVIFDCAEKEVEFCEWLTDEEKEYFFDTVSAKFDRQKYNSLVAKQGGYMLEKFFESVKDVIEIKLTGEPYIDSPAFYNFRNDWLVFCVEISQEELDKILKTVENNDDFWEFIDERWRSRSGFWSFMPHTKVKFLEAIKGRDAERALAMYLYWVYFNSDEYDEEFGYDYDICEYISGNSGLMEFVDDAGCNAILEKVFAVSAVS